MPCKKSKVGCLLPKSPQVVLGTSRRLEVDLGSHFYQVGSDSYTKVAPRPSGDHVICCVAAFLGSRLSAQATAGKGLAQGPYVADKVGVEPTTLRLKVIVSTKAPPRPTKQEQSL